MIEEEIEVRVVYCLTARGRTEYLKMLHAPPFQFGFVVLQPVYGFVADHRSNIPEFQAQVLYRRVRVAYCRNLLRLFPERPLRPHLTIHCAAHPGVSKHEVKDAPMARHLRLDP
jgi:hypothetical protein